VGRLLRPALLTTSVLGLVVGFTLLAAVALGGAPPVDEAARPVAAPARPAVTSDGGIVSLQARLAALPGDHRGWSRLALAYVEEARVTGDASYYAKADRALARADRLAPGDPSTLTAQASLANARHDFPVALQAADAAVRANPYRADAHLARSDALTELGRYAAARRAAGRADDLDPGPATFARLSYAAELRGDLDEATRLMRLARDAAGTSATTYAFASFHLGELARAMGRRPAAAGHYARALGADEGYLPALAGRARLAVAGGDLAAAERDYRAVVAGLPLPEYVVELAELYLATGRSGAAGQQLSVAVASARAAAAGGVGTGLETALFEADHGEPARALDAARAEWADRRSIHAADALGWALHITGRDEQALRYVRRATRLGTPDARLWFHRGAVEAALGLDRAARRHLRRAIDLDGGAAPLRTEQARGILDHLGGAR
jgi:tetratricopeptide (TPR) repeat protein